MTNTKKYTLKNDAVTNKSHTFRKEMQENKHKKKPTLCLRLTFTNVH